MATKSKTKKPRKSNGVKTIPAEETPKLDAATEEFTDESEGQDSDTPTEVSADVEGPPVDAAVSQGAESPADGAPVPAENSPETPAELDGHRAVVACGASTETVDEMTNRLCRLIRDRKSCKDESKESAKEFRERLEDYDERINALGEQIESANVEESFDYVAKLAVYRNKTTGQIIRTRPLVSTDLQETLPFDGKPASTPPVEAPPPVVAIAGELGTFDRLQPGQVWRSEAVGLCKIVKVEGESVTVTDELELETDFTKAEWDPYPARMLEQPKIEIGQHWEASDGEGKSSLHVEGLKDDTVVVRWDLNNTTDTLHQIEFCEATLVSAAPVEA